MHDLSDLGDDSPDFFASEVSGASALAASQRSGSHQAGHGDLAFRTVSLVLDAPRDATKKDASMLRVCIRNRFCFKLFLQALNLIFKVLTFSLKPVLFLLDTCELLANLDKSISED